MKKNLMSIAAAVVAAVALTSCGVAAPVKGVILQDTKFGHSVTSNSGASKVGTSSLTGYLGIVAQGDASIDAACKAAGITKIHHVDYQAKSIIGIINTYTTIVYGQ